MHSQLNVLWRVPIPRGSFLIGGVRSDSLDMRPESPRCAETRYFLQELY